MNKDKLYEMILDYLDNNLDSSQLGLLKKELKDLGYSIDDLSALQRLVDGMDEMRIPEPSSKMSDSFYQMLEEESNKLEEEDLMESFKKLIHSMFQRQHYPRFAYATLILFMGWIIGYWFTPNASIEKQMNQMTAEMQSMREIVMVSMMDKPLVSERLKALQMVKNDGIASDGVVHALLHTLNNDPDANVRMAAVEVLLAYANQSEVRKGLKESVLTQESPLVQLSMVEGLIAMNDKNSIPVFENLIRSENVHPAVKEISRVGINQLN